MRQHRYGKGLGPVGARTHAAGGFSLLELMVAMTLGLLVSAGVITLFTGTNNTYRVQDALARVQENGRYAISRLTDDIRGSSYQFITASGTSRTLTTSANGILSSMLVPTVYSSGAITLSDNATVAVQPAWPANTPYPLRAETFLQGYECTTTACTPNVPASLALPAMGTTTGLRVPGTDVLTTRSLRGNGWSISLGQAVLNCAGATLTSITIPAAVPAIPAAENFQPQDWALVVIGASSRLFRVGVAGGVLTPAGLIAGTSVPCGSSSGSAAQEAMLYNFSRQLDSVTYFVQVQPDLNPDAPAGRLIPTLMRRANVAAAEQMIQGVDRLDFVYGVENYSGNVRYTTADTLSSADGLTPPAGFSCTLPPDQAVLAGYGRAGSAVGMDPGCAWRATRVVEPHLLLNTVNNVPTLADVDLGYRYSLSVGSGVTYDFTPRAHAATLPTGLAAGRMMRREFTAGISIRSFNP